MPSLSLVLTYGLPLLALALLIDCWRSERLAPLFGSKVAARVLWSLSFLLANPILIVLYLVVPRFGWVKLERERLRDTLLAGLVVAMGWLQLGPALGVPAPVDRKQVPAAASFGLQLMTQESSQGSSFSWSSQSLMPPMPVARVRVTASTDPLSLALAEEIAALFAAQAWAEVVELWPRGHAAADELVRGPDLFVDVDASEISCFELPLRATFRGSAQVTMDTRPNLPENGFWSEQRLGIGRPRAEMTISLRQTRTGLAIGSDRYGAPADALARTFREGIFASLREDVQQGGVLSAPDGALAPQPELAPLEKAAAAWVEGQRDVELTEWSHGPFVHHRAAWRFQDTRPSPAVLGELEEALQVAGWHRIKYSEEESQPERAYLTAYADDNRDTRLIASRWPQPAWRQQGVAFHIVDGEAVHEPVPAPQHAGDLVGFSVTITSSFSDAELEQLGERHAVALGAALAEGSAINADDPDLAVLAMLYHELEDAPREILRQALVAAPTPHAGRLMMLATLQAEAGDLAAATRAARIVDLVNSMDRDSTLTSELKSLVKKHELVLEDPEPLPTDPDESRTEAGRRDLALLLEAGFPQLPDGPLEFELGLGETITFAGCFSTVDALLWTVTVEALEPALLVGTRSDTRGMSSESTGRSLRNTSVRDGYSASNLSGEVRDGRAVLRLEPWP